MLIEKKYVLVEMMLPKIFLKLAKRLTGKTIPKIRVGKDFS